MTPEEFLPYKNEHGMIVYSDHPPASGDNDVLQTCYYLLASPPDEEEKTRLCFWLGDYTRLDFFTKKNPRDDDIESVDNVIAHAYMSVVLDFSHHAAYLLDAARSTGWIWPHGENLGRFVTLEPLLELAAKEKPGIIGQVFLALSLVVGLFQKGEDTYSLSRLMVEIIKKTDTSKFLKRSAQFWEDIQKARGKTMKQNLIRYGWDSNSPFVRLMNEKY